MKGIIKYKCILAILGIGSLTLGACVHDSYEECPQQGTVDIAMTYYWHNKGADRDLFADQVNRVEFYIFDKEGLFCRRDVTETSAFGSAYHHRLTLPGGDYTLLSWCNGGDAWIPRALTPGVSTLAEAHMQLTATPTTAGGAYTVGSLPETLFYGVPQQTLLHVSNGKTVCDSIDLMKLTHDVHIRIRWKDHNGAYCTYKGHEDIARPYLEIKNGEYDFSGKPQRERFLTYMPRLLPGEVETPIDYASVRSDFRVGRLMAEGSTAKVAIAEVLADGNVTRRYTRSLMELIRLTGQYDTQEQIDRENHFDVDIDFCCIEPDHLHANSWTVVGIRINGWVVSEIESEL